MALRQWKRTITSTSPRKTMRIGLLRRGIGSHYEDDGSTATDRAHAVGYPGALVTENWARGPGLTVYNCIYVMWDDPDHWDNMLDPNRKEFGAGVALDDSGFTVYVVNFSNYDTNDSQPIDATDTTGDVGTGQPQQQGRSFMRSPHRHPPRMAPLSISCNMGRPCGALLRHMAFPWPIFLP